MNTLHERHISQPDAARLAIVIDTRALTHPSERDDLDELADTLSTARVLPADEVPADSAALGARVAIRLTHDATVTPNSLVLVEPKDAAPAQGRISVVSPLGRTLLGLRPGMRSPVALPGGRDAEVEVVSVEREEVHRDEADAAVR
ncbi:MAG TPA: GreA/GreB family elongation factor [Casimicrobiaceae bacterium]|nr:GreA/GreB family elongation factor [Casimicrobiaceae bacterium]